MFQKYKTAIIVVIVILILFVLYSMFIKKGKDPVLTATTAGSASIGPENNELIALLSQLNSIRLNKDIFSNPVLLTLYDYSVTLIDEPVSRPNPFAPIGSDGFIPVIQNQNQIDIGAGL